VLHIAICDDNQQHRQEINRLMGKALFARTDFVIDNYDDGRQIIEAIEKKRFFYDLLMLDIHMKMDGIQTARYIRQHQVDIDIIFVTISHKHVYEGYTYKAFAYLLKPLDEKKVMLELNRYLDEKETTEEYLNISVRGAINKIPIGKILYIESDSRKLLIHLKNREVEFYGKLDAVQNALGEQQFVRCHQSYLVNKNYVSSVGRNSLVIEDVPIPVSRKYQQTAKDILDKRS